jgi:putative membrane protein
MESTQTTGPIDIPPSHPHPGWVITAAIEGFRSLIWALIPLLFSVRDRGGVAIVATTAAFGLAIVLWRAIQWRFITYSAENDTISLTTGVLGKSHKTVHPDRVHAVDTVEPPIGRLLGISELRISTAGSGETITIPAMSNADADQLRRWIAMKHAGTAATGSPDTGDAAAPVPQLICRLSFKEVLIAGLTSGRIAPALAISAFGVRVVTEVLPQRTIERIPFDPDQLTPMAIVALAGVAAVVAWGISILGSVIVNWNFTLERSGDLLVVTSGLFERQRNTIHVQRVQGLTIVEGILRQPFGCASIDIESAAPRRGSDEDSAQYRLVPFLPLDQAPRLIEAALPELRWVTEPVTLTRLPRRALRRYLVPVVRDWIVLAGLTSAILWRSTFGAWWFGLALLLVIPPLLVHAWLQHRDAGWAAGSDNHLVIRNRSIDRRTTYMSGKRVQIRELSQDWLQRRARLATFTLTTPARGHRAAMSVRHADRSDGDALLDHLSPR